MLFVELRFFLFFAIVFVVHWLIPKGIWRKAWLLACSYVFYGVWDWRFLSLIIGSTLVDFVIGNLLESTRSKWRRKSLLSISLVCNLGLLAVFKYFNFFVESAAEILTALGFEPNLPTLSLILPVGISFYTFQTLSYSIDIYRGTLRPVKSLLDFSLFVAFFPQLVAGPIVRASEFLPQLRTTPSFTSIRFRTAFVLFLFGFFKKACISDNLAPYVDAYFEMPSAYDSESAWIAVLLYSIQIYCDFSGYSDMAIACAAMLGYRLTLNFAFPYFAIGLQEFWRRWHISLSTWLRDYVYISLGGNRVSGILTYRNLMITMLLGGIWHGAAWTFVIWGAIHGVALCVERAIRSSGRTSGRQGSHLILQVLLWGATMYIVCVTWVFFRASSFESAFAALSAFTTLSSDGHLHLDSVLWFVILALGAAHFLSYRFDLVRRFEKVDATKFAVGYACAWSLALSTVSIANRPFIYFQF